MAIAFYSHSIYNHYNLANGQFFFKKKKKEKNIKWNVKKNYFLNLICLWVTFMSNKVAYTRFEYDYYRNKEKIRVASVVKDTYYVLYGSSN